MDEKAAMLMSMLIEKHGVNPLDIGDVVTGCALQMKEHYMMGGRIVNMLAGLPVDVPGQASERVCCSGMSALHQGAMEIMTDQCRRGVRQRHGAHDPRGPRSPATTPT